MVTSQSVAILLFTLASVRSQVADGNVYLTANFILATEVDLQNIYQVSLDDGRTVRLPVHADNPMSVVYDPKIQMIFWVSQADSLILTSRLNGTDERVIKSLTYEQSPEGIAIDPDEQFIFYSDGALSTINLVTYDGLTHLQVVMNAKNPRAIETDRKNKMIYWTDWGLETIEIAEYDGANRRIIVTRPGSWINGITLDIPGRRMYWTDAKSQRIEMADMDGSNVQIIMRHNDTLDYANGTEVFGAGEAHYYGVAVDKTHIYFTDWQRNGIYMMPLMRPDSYTYTRFDTSNNMTAVNGISIYTASNYYQAPKSHCSNHQCSDLCIPLVVNFKCSCPDDRRISSDNVTCSAEQTHNGPDIIWLEHDGYLSGWVRGIKGDPSVYLRAMQIHTWSIRSPAWHWTAIDVNYEHSLLYMFDRYDRYFVQLSLNGTLSLKIIDHGASSEVNGLAYDWISHNLYWTDSLYNWIRVTQPGTNNTKTLIEDTLDQPHGIAVWPHQGLMFWTDWGQTKMIAKANMDGTNVVKLVTTGLNYPMGITIDYDNRKLYYTNTHTIESYDLNNGARVSYGRQSQNTFISVAIYQNFMFGLDEGVVSADGYVEPNLWFFDMDEGDSVRGMRLPLPRAPYAITMFSSSRQSQQGPAPCANHKCAQLCVPIPDPFGTGLKAQCLCRDGYKTPDNGVTCTATLMSQGAMYVYALDDRICAAPIKHTMKTSADDPFEMCFFNSTVNNYKFRAVDYNYNEGEIYFSEGGLSVKTIRRARLEDKGVNSVVVFSTGDVRGLVVDWLSSNMYWTDATANAIWVSRLEGQYMLKLVTDAPNPGGIALDLQYKRLYWAESSHNRSHIIMADLDGANRYTFINSDAVATFTSLAVDYVAQRLYWVNPTENKIYSASLLDGTGVSEQLLSATYNNIYGVTTMQDFVGFTGESTEHGGMHVVDKVSGTEVVDGGVTHENRTIYDIVAYYSGNQRLYLGGENGSCTVANGGCTQLCFQLKSGHRCGCTAGTKVAADRTTCEPSYPLLKDNFFLLADDYRHLIYQADDNLGNFRALNFPQTDRPIGMTYDFTYNRVYWADYKYHSVKSMDINGGAIQQLFEEAETSRTEGLAFDPVSQLLYYTDSGRHAVAVMNPTGYYHKLLVRGVSSPRAIVLDPANGYMYITSRLTDLGSGRIIRYTMDGKNETVLVTGLAHPNGLGIDFINKKMYWCDAHSELIQSANLNGTNVRKVATLAAEADPFGLTVHGGNIYWSDWGLKGVFRTSLDGSSGVTTLGADMFIGLNDIKYFSKADLVSTACSTNNGQCSHFCFPTTAGGRTCGCPDNSDIAVPTKDGRNCDNIEACATNQYVDATCSLRIGDKCTVVCGEGFQATVTQITCLTGSIWSNDVSSLCEVAVTCPILQTPHNAVIESGNCDIPAEIGKTCTHRCIAGTTHASGDAVHKCGSNLKWTGNPIVCYEITTTPVKTFTRPPTTTTTTTPTTTRPSTTTHTTTMVKSTTTVAVIFCDLLPVPTNATVQPESCNRVQQAEGSVCTFKCLNGTQHTSGQKVRTCLDTEHWSGAPVVCTLNQPTVAKATGGHGTSAGLTAGIVIITLLVVAIAIVGLFIMRKRRQDKDRSQFRSSSPGATNGTSSYDTPDATPGDLSPTYSVNRGSVNLDGSIAFDNPAYGTLPEARSNGAKVDTSGIAVVDSSQATAVANPLFGVNNGSTDKKLLLDDVGFPPVDQTA